MYTESTNPISGAFNTRKYLVKVSFDKTSTVVAVTSDYAKTPGEAIKVAEERARKAFQDESEDFLETFGCIARSEAFDDTAITRKKLGIDGESFDNENSRTYQYVAGWFEEGAGGVRQGHSIIQLPKSLPWDNGLGELAGSVTGRVVGDSSNVIDLDTYRRQRREAA